MTYRYLAVCSLLAMVSACGDDDPSSATDAADSGTESESAVDDADRDELMAEAQVLLESVAERSGVSPGTLAGTDDPNRFTEEENVFLPSTVAVANLDDTSRAEATLPVYEGVRPNGDAALYVLTEAADFEVARFMGLNYSPRMRFGAGTAGAMNVTIDDDGRMVFPGDVDFSPERNIEPGNPDNPDEAFPPNMDTIQAGAVGDAEWSSLVVTPAGNVFNVQQVRNSTGDHDRVVRFDEDDLTATQVTLQLLDGFQGGEQFYYHLVTDASDVVPAALELGVYTPRLANLPAFGSTRVDSESALLGFSPNVNGIATGPEQQGLNTTIVSDQEIDIPIDPINVFPLDPANDQEDNNNYSPMWDAHLSMWTADAIEQNLRRRITSFGDLQTLVDEGLITSFAADGPSDGFVAGLNSAEAIINCPVIAQPRF